jgi:PAS domain S-box-containing protein
MLLALIISKHEGSGSPVYILGHISLTLMIIHGFLSARYQFRNGVKKSARFLLIAILLLTLLTIDDIFYIHFRENYPFNLPSGVLPFDYSLIFFMILMGGKLSADMQKKAEVEKQLVSQESNWLDLLEKIDLVVVQLARDGRVQYVNPYYLNISGFMKENVVGKNWFLNFLPENEGRKVYEIFQDNLDEAVHSKYQNSIITSDGQTRMIIWSNILLKNGDDQVVGTLSIGSDITDQEKALEEINSLKRKLELENIQLKSELRQDIVPDRIIGDSDAIHYVLKRAHQVSETATTVLLEGETGVGKEIIANYIQSNSTRSDKPYIKVNCSAIPSTLLESELFGHAKGAFTGADKSKKGLVELADGGTLFLDEIGEFPLELQPKLLRFLQEGEFQPLGSEAGKRVDIRIIAATNRSLQKAIEKGAFREDLYYRISVYPITIPPLRDRKEDIPDLIDFFVKQFARKHGKSVQKISQLVFDELSEYSWPGNIRELQNVLERAVIVCNSNTIKSKDIAKLSTAREKRNLAHEEGIDTLENIERTHIERALKFTKWKIHGKEGAAELLGINPNTLRSRMKKLNIVKPQ